MEIMKSDYILEKELTSLPLYQNPALEIPFQLEKRMKALIKFVWEREEEKIYQTLIKILKEAQKRKPPWLLKRDQKFDPKNRWSQNQVYFICFGDHLKSKSKKTSPLRILYHFLRRHFDPKVFQGLTVHLLPIYTSPYRDRGFDVENPFKINKKMGTWEDIRDIGKDFNIALDFVFNHFSKDSPWFQKFLAGDPQFKDFFIAFDEDDPTKMTKLKEIRQKYQKLIYRPRAHDPFVRVKKENGRDTWVYMTFSLNQPDLNYQNPKVFLKMSEVFLYYILQGATTLRLDAIPYLWKEWGTSCAHHPKSHAILELFRAISDAFSPSVKLLAESMEPPQDSRRYLSSGGIKKAHMAYNFLPCGLIPFTMFKREALRFEKALRFFKTPSKETAQAVVCGKTHDGTSLNPCRAPKTTKGEPMLTEEEINWLAKIYEKRGVEELKERSALPQNHPLYVPQNFAQVFKKKYGQPPRFANYKTVVGKDGKPTKIVYEVISTYGSLFKGNPQKIVAALSLGLPLKGIPFIYFTALFAAPNDYNWYLRFGNPRQLNEGRIFVEDLKKALADKSSSTHKVFFKMHHLLKIRASHPAFHPQGEQKRLRLRNKAIFSLLRVSPDKRERIIVLHNISGRPQKGNINLKRLGIKTNSLVDLITKTTYSFSKSFSFTLSPYQILWLKV